jgi:hypothetical protein
MAKVLHRSEEEAAARSFQTIHKTVNLQCQAVSLRLVCNRVKISGKWFRGRVEDLCLKIHRLDKWALTLR